MTLQAMIERKKKRRAVDAERHADHDGDLCMLCHARGADKRSLFIRCFYAVEEMIPEAIDLSGVEGREGYYLRICKNCRGELLGLLGDWRGNMVARRGLLKDHDGHDDEDNEYRTIPVRENGRIIMLTQDEWDHRATDVKSMNREGI